MSPKEREEIEGWAKDAGLQEEDIKAAVDLEMRLRFVRGFDETRDLFVSIYLYSNVINKDKLNNILKICTFFL